MAIPLRNVLVATDFSEPAAVGIEWAARVARDRSATLHVVHVVSPPMPVADFTTPPLTLDREVHEAAERRLDALLAEPPLAGLDAHAVLRDGTPSIAVLDVAEEVSADLVVVGTRGLTGFSHLLLGSTAERIVQRATMPVLSVHPGDRRPEGGPRTVLVPTDFSADAGAALTAASASLRLRLRLDRDGGDGGTRVILLHVYHVPAEYSTYGPSAALYRLGDEMEKAIVERLEALAEPLRGTHGDGPMAVEVVALPGIPSEVIVQQAEELGADLVAMGTHGRSGVAHLLLGSTAQRVVQHAPCPVLTVRQEAT
jgi:nucleotide-binding universal stress UspA family protein